MAAGEAVPVMGRVPAGTLAPAAPVPGSLVRAIEDDPDALVYVLVNVGDGDTQLLVLPPDRDDGRRRLVIVDVATRRKLPDLLDALHAAGVVAEPPGTPGQVALLVATHPHFDHIGGMADLLTRHADHPGWVDQFWDPGYYFPGPSFHTLMRRLEDGPVCRRRLQPTSGTTMYLDAVRLTVLGPGVGLRSRFDTYGVGVNDASITLMVDYPATTLYTEPDPQSPARSNRRETPGRSRRLLLGGDAQFTSWAQTTVDFPDLAEQYNPVLAKELRAAVGHDALAADVFKLSHHASKHGINLELLERVGAAWTLISATDGGGRYHFPHLLAVEAAREAAQATTDSAATRLPDHELGIHLTGARVEGDADAAAGSIAILVPRSPRAALRMFRLMDDARDDIDLAAACEVVD